MQTESQKLQVQFLQTLSKMMFGNVTLSPVAHSTCGYDDKTTSATPPQQSTLMTMVMPDQTPHGTS